MDSTSPTFSGANQGITAEQLEKVAQGWSIKEDILDKYVYNDSNDNIGTIEDLLVTPDDAISYAIIGVGGFLGMGRHDVAIPIYQLIINKSQITLPGVTTESLKAMPAYEYK